LRKYRGFLPDRPPPDYPFVMVVGRSGSGKSSLIYAGLLPALRRERNRFWNVRSLCGLLSKLTRDEMCLAGYPDRTGIDVCQ
jgi:hypothetical protein